MTKEQFEKASEVQRKMQPFFSLREIEKAQSVQIASRDSSGVLVEIADPLLRDILVDYANKRLANYEQQMEEI